MTESVAASIWQRKLAGMEGGNELQYLVDAEELPDQSEEDGAHPSSDDQNGKSDSVRMYSR